MDEILTLTEIRSRFDSEWVLLAEPETNDSLEILAGRVVCHSKDREEVYRKAVDLHPRRFAMLFTGTIPLDTAVVL